MPSWPISRGASPALTEFTGLEHFNLQADINHKAGKAAGKILLARGRLAAGRSAASVFGTRGRGFSLLFDSHVNGRGSTLSPSQTVLNFRATDNRARVEASRQVLPLQHCC